MTKLFTIEICDGSRFVGDEDIERAEDAINAAIEREGWTTAEQLRAAQAEQLLRGEMEPHDAALADAWERIESAGNIALTAGWHNPNGAGLTVHA